MGPKPTVPRCRFICSSSAPCSKMQKPIPAPFGPRSMTGASHVSVTSSGEARMDELPQFWNVLVGSMSLVGPRPERPFFTRDLSGDIPAYEDRVARTKPGITGLAQISLDYDTSVGSVRKKVFHDVAYNAHLYGLFSYLKIEIKILFLTVFVVLTGKGAR